MDLRVELRPVTASPSLFRLRAAFLERSPWIFSKDYLGFSSGRGDGSLELLFLVALGIIVLVTVFHRKTK